MLVFSSLIAYIGFDIRPRNLEDTRYTIAQIVESKANEVGMWIRRTASEYRIISAIPAFQSMDVREITPMIERFTRAQGDDETMAGFSYIGKNGFCWINSQVVQNLMDYEDYRLAYSDEREFIIGLPIVNEKNREVMLMYYPILSVHGEKEALICAAIPTVRLKEIVNTIQIYEGKTWIMNRQGEIITTYTPYFYENYLSEDTLQTLDFDHITSSDSLALTTTSGEQATLFVSPVNSYDDWIFCTLVEDAVINRPTQKMIIGCLLLFVFLMFITWFLGTALIYSVLRPIRRLQSNMQEVENGNLRSYNVSTTGQDEIYSLGMTFNKMLDEISRLIERNVQERSQKQEAELRVLQAQIKPHFLYNTLDNFKWLAKEAHADELAKAITSLSTYFRIFLSNGQEKITLAQEFKHTAAYLQIQKTRLKHQLQYTMELEEVCQNLPIIKIIIQPIVENALKHGFRLKEGVCEIHVRAAMHDSWLVITVTDNGLGMSEEQRCRLLADLQANVEGEHVGLMNTLRRLKIAYGEAAAIEIESALGKGTAVTLRIPQKEVQS